MTRRRFSTLGTLDLHTRQKFASLHSASLFPPLLARPSFRMPFKMTRNIFIYMWVSNVVFCSWIIIMIQRWSSVIPLMWCFQVKLNASNRNSLDMFSRRRAKPHNYSGNQLSSLKSIKVPHGSALTRAKKTTHNTTTTLQHISQKFFLTCIAGLLCMSYKRSVQLGQSVAQFWWVSCFFSPRLNMLFL